ncbi:MAG: dihydropteroate synthase, partial [Eubacterium sp.]|nr:dihydropteroate synthase [Eubacterium sp.]
MIWICRDKKIEYGKRTLIMGIINITPDSFSDGGKYLNSENAVFHALELIKDGADIIDLGAQSTRPGYDEISPEEEWRRLEPVLTQLRKLTDKPVSVDTYFPSVAEKAIALGADIINDVSGKCSKETVELINKSGAGWIVMHNGAGGVETVKEFFNKNITICNKNQLCFDMGIGFGKTYEQNLELISNVKKYKPDGVPLLLGVSRKRVIGESCK